MIKLIFMFTIALAATSFAAEEAKKQPHIETKWITQKLDHFNNNDTRTWQMALADLAHFIRTIKTDPTKKNSNVILAGDFYAGSLVIWFRKLYPKLAVGGWASSPPLLAKLDFKEPPWYYQVCNEFGWFTTTTSTQQPFGTKLPLKYFHFFCKEIFGDKFTPEYMENQIYKTNNLYGGLNSDVKDVFITYGQLDPWIKVGIQDVTKATIIPMESHIRFLDSIKDEDSKQPKDAKMKLKQYVKYMLKSPKKQH